MKVGNTKPSFVTFEKVKNGCQEETTLMNFKF
jgi:hypothetical protein